MFIRKLRLVLITFCCIVLLACSSGQPQLTSLDSGDVILAFGDSLTYGTGATNSNTDSYPAVLERLSGYKVVNAGVPGEVSEEGLVRIDEELEFHEPALVIICHGGNDMIRQKSKDELKQNLVQMVKRVQQSGAEVVLVAVPSFNITLKVPELYQEVATELNIPIEASIVRKLEASPSLKSDQIHPNSQGYQQFAEAIYELLTEIGAI
jgi:lysophospholipase L1-like esterase